MNAIIRECLGIDHELAVAIQLGLREYVVDLEAVFDSAEGQERFRRLLARYTGRPLEDDVLRKRIDGVAERLDLFTVEEARTLFICFEEEKVALARQKLAGLNEEYERWVLAKASAENDRERSLARKRCQELEQELTLWESRLTPLDDQLTSLRSRLTDHRERLHRASLAVKDGGNRRKAEIVRELFAEIVLHFRQVKRAKQVRSEFLPEKTEFKITFMDCSSPRSSRRCRAPAPTGTSRGPGFRRRTRSC